MDYDAAAYGRAFADVYDEWYGTPSGPAALTDVTATVDTVTDLAGPGGRVLELGVGTGRLALPLADRGLRVTGLDASTEMLDRLRAKPGGDTVATVVGDMVDVAAAVGPERFDVVLCAFNTLFLLAGVDDQRRCLAGAHDVLAPGGSLVVEALAPDRPALDEAPGSESSDVTVGRIELDLVTLLVTRHRPDAQVIVGQHVELSEAGGVRLRPWVVHYLHLDQLDGLAAAAGLHLESRWSGWDRAPFTPGDARHVSVFRRPA